MTTKYVGVTRIRRSRYKFVSGMYSKLRIVYVLEPIVATKYAMLDLILCHNLVVV